MIIRKARSDDAQAIQKLLYSSWLDTYISSELNITSAVLERYASSFLDPQTVIQKRKKLVQNDKTKYFIAETSGEIVGYGKMKITANEWKIEALYVKASVRSKGIGSHILQKMLESKTLPPPLISVWVASYNTRALSFYKRQNFKVSKEKGKHFISDTIFIPTVKMINTF